MMKVQSCCGCVSLRTGTLIIGSLTLISAILNVSLIPINISKISMPSSYDFNTEMTPEKQAAMILSLIMIIFWIACLIYSVVCIGITIAMFFGVFKKIPYYVIPWLALSFSGFVSSISISIAFCIIVAMLFPISMFFFTIFISGCAIILQYHFLIVVYSHYKEIVEFGQQGHPNDEMNHSKMPITYHNV